MSEMPFVDSFGRTWKYGEFFPPAVSPFGYNETLAMDYFPMVKDKAMRGGFTWREKEKNQYNPTIGGSDLPDDIQVSEESIVNEVIECPACRKSFRIIKSEWEFLKELNLPLPRKCPECRRKDRFLRVNFPKIYRRSCQCAGTKSENRVYANTTVHQHGAGKCPNEFETSYAPHRPEIVYCEQCYQAEVV